LKVCRLILIRSSRTFFGDMITSAPKAAPPMTTNSERWSKAPMWPPAMMKPPRTEPNTIKTPTMIIMRKSPLTCQGNRFTRLHIGFDGQNGLGMNLANARLAQATHRGDLPQAQIFKVIQGDDLAVQVG